MSTSARSADAARRDERTARLGRWNTATRMSELDALMWRGEQPPDFVSTGVVLEVLSSTPDHERLRTAFEWAVTAVPRLRQVVIEPVAPTGPPAWGEPDTFDLDRHVRTTELPAPAGMSELMDVALRIGRTPIDRTRPLWTCTLAPLADGRAGLVLHAHHSLMDGAAMIELLSLVHSDTTVPTAKAPVPERAAPTTTRGAALSGVDLLHGARDLPGRLARVVDRVGGAVRNPGDTLEALGSLRRVMSTPPTTASSPLMAGYTGTEWRFGTLNCSLADLKQAGKAAGGSVNDAYIAGLLGGLRRYHDARGIPLGTIPTGMPVSVRRPDDPPGGNRFAAAMIAGPAGEPDPRERIAAIRGAVMTARAEPAAEVLGTLAPLLNRLPRPILLQALKGLPTIDLNGSNIAGMREPVYAAGAEVQEIYIFGPLPGVAVMATLLSYAGTCFVGVNVDAGVYADVEDFWACMQRGLDEVLELAR